MDDKALIQGFHGTNVHAAGSILQRNFTLSRNDYDWLGDGLYFFQDAPARAWEWASSRYGSEAAVIGAVIRLTDCMDFLDIEWAKALTALYDAFLSQLKRGNHPLPAQTSGAHRLDRAVINYSVGVLAEQGVQVRVVRAAFIEGVPIFPQSALFDRAHVQVAVRDTMLIERVWLVERGEIAHGNSV